MGTSRPPLSFESNLDQPGVGASWTTKSAAIITGRSNAISAAGCGALGILSFSVSADCMASSSAPPIVAADQRERQQAQAPDMLAQAMTMMMQQQSTMLALLAQIVTNLESGTAKSGKPKPGGSK